MKTIWQHNYGLISCNPQSHWEDSQLYLIQAANVLLIIFFRITFIKLSFKGSLIVLELEHKKWLFGSSGWAKHNIAFQQPQGRTGQDTFGFFGQFKDHNSGRKHANQTNDSIFFIYFFCSNLTFNFTFEISQNSFFLKSKFFIFLIFRKRQATLLLFNVFYCFCMFVHKHLVNSTGK